MMYLTLIDLIVLKAVKDGDQPTQAELLDTDTKHGLVNDLILHLKLPPIYNVRLLTANWGLLTSITRLRNAGLMPHPAPYRLTKEGEQFLKSLGDDVRTWPISIPCDRESIYLEDAAYVPEELR